jgi:fatty acyl-CoA reductase
LLEKTSSDIFSKLIPVNGDVGEDNLGLTDAGRQLLIDNVNVVFHSAATLDFEATLKPTIDINLLGTRRVMQLCQQIKNLRSVVHVSSAYVNSFLLETQEILYPAPADAEKIINLSKSLTESALDEMTPSLLESHPNTYTFTKHLAEHEVNKCAGKFPCGIVRPSMSKLNCIFITFNFNLLYFNYSHSSMERTDSRLDYFQKWTTRIFNGCFKRCCTTFTCWNQLDLRLCSS